MPLAAERETLSAERGPMTAAPARLGALACLVWPECMTVVSVPPRAGTLLGRGPLTARYRGAAVDGQGGPTSRGSRLCFMAALSALPEESGLTFGALGQLLDVTGRHPLPHLRVLEEASHVVAGKGCVGRMPRTACGPPWRAGRRS